MLFDYLIRILGSAQALKDLHASSILAVLEEDHETVQVQARFATDLDKFLRAKTEQLCCTS